MNKIKNLRLKIIIVSLGTLFVAWILFLLYNYSINIEKASWEGTMLSISLIGLLGEFLVIWIIFGIDIIRNKM